LKFLTLLSVSVMTLGLVHAALPPDARADLCQESGGTWNGNCNCPAQATSLWDRCWLLTPKEACRRLGGRIDYEEGLVGPAGASFLCKRWGEDITNLARERAVKYDGNQVKPNRTVPSPPQDGIRVVRWPQIIFLTLGSLVIIVLAYLVYNRIS